MLGDFIMLAALDLRPELPLQAPRDGFRLDATDTLLVLGAVVILAALLFFWAFYIRRRPTDKNGIPGLVSHRHRSSSSSNDPNRRVKRRRRRHHPDNYPRNPTLGETGGLPPVRSDAQQPPPQPQ